MRTLYLHGSLGARFGESFSLDVSTPAEAVRALCVQLPGFEQAVRSFNWHVIRGPVEEGKDLDEEGIAVGLGKENEIHLIPAIAGAGDGVWSAIAGVVLIVAGVITQNYYLVGAGAGMLIGGIAQSLAATPISDDYGDREKPDQRPSFLFDGPTNTSTQGLPVPVIYGRVKVGSAVVSAGMTAEELDE